MSKLTEKVDLLQLKKCEAYLDEKFKGAEKEENLSEKKAIYTEIVDYCNGVEEFTSFEEKAKAELVKIEESLYGYEKEAKAIPSLKEEKEGLLKENSELKDKVSKMVDFIEEARDAVIYLKKSVSYLSEKNATLKKLYEQSEAEKNTLVSADEVIRMKEEEEDEKEDLEKEVESLKREIASMEERLARSERVKKQLILQLESEDKDEDDEELEESEHNDEDDMEDEVEEKKSKKESTSKDYQKKLVEKSGLHESYASEDVLNWYEDMLKLTEARTFVTENKDVLLSSPNVSEAMKKYRILRMNKIEKSVQNTLEESVRPSFTVSEDNGFNAILNNAKKKYKGFQ